MDGTPVDHGPAQAPAPLRLSISLPGSASLGAYQAGALAALAVAVEELRRSGRDVRVDALGGVSAGSLVALFYAHSLLTGSDASAMLRRSWVDDVSSGLLRSRSTRAPLDFSQLEPRLRDLLGSPDGHGDHDHDDADHDARHRAGAEEGRRLRRQRTPVGLHIGLTNLLGLSYPVDTGGGPTSAMSFVDWGRFHLDPDAGPEQLVAPEGRSPVDVALASAAHPLAFAPRMLDRSGDREGYAARGIDNLPDSGALWYSDGGLVESEPVGRTLSAAHGVAGEADAVRLHLVIDPRSSGPSGSARWGDPDQLPSWVAGIRRSMSILPSQALHEDLRHVEDANGRLARVDSLVEAIADRLDDHDGTLRRRLATLVDGDGHDGDGQGDRPLADLLRRALEETAGVAGKERVRVDVISPLLLAREGDHDVPGLLAGDIVGAFGGFLSRRLRESDFVLGWDSALTWTRDGFSQLGIDDDEADRIRGVMTERRGASWDEVNAGGRSAGKLGRHARLELARLALHIARIVGVELLPAAIAGRLRSRSRAHGEEPRDRPSTPEGGTLREELTSHDDRVSGSV